MALAAETQDVHSRGNPAQCRVTHAVLDLTVDFEAKRLHGSATLKVERKDPAAPLVLDTKGMTIEGVTSPQLEKPLEYRLGEPDPILGSALEIELPEGVDAVAVSYATGPKASALQWLEPANTDGKRHPFLFTQAQAIHARSFVPIQDSPGVRITYEATLRVPKGLRAIMAADPVGEPEPGIFRFKMPLPIPSYLIALAVGDLESIEVGPRSDVHAEPGVVKRAAAEFEDIEKMIASIEARFGSYEWGRYDVLVLPPSFPFGGMENPKVTFATPTILAGDKSLVALIAHELAHSWSGNLVTNATWRDFWLNEGFTVYLERRIIEDLYGPERAEMEAVLGLKTLQDELGRLPAAEQILHINLAGRDPDDGVTQVPYEKGALFLSTLEHAFGREKFDPWLKGYFRKFAFQSITTERFVAYLKETLLAGDPEAAAKIDLNAWLEEPGLPADYPKPTSPRFDIVKAAADRWLAGEIKAADLPAKGWDTHEWLHFLEGLPDKLSPEQMADLDAAFRLTEAGNAEIAQRWLVLAVRNAYAPADARVEQFLTTIGRRKFLMPLYTELLKVPGGRARAEAIFAKARPFYHPIAVDSVERLLRGA